MLLAFIGAIMILFSFAGNSMNFVMLVLGIIFVVLGVLAIDVHHDNVKAWHNRQQYWANGREPDWKAQQSSRRKYCKLCGNLMSSGERYCSHCGRKL